MPYLNQQGGQLLDDFLKRDPWKAGDIIATTQHKKGIFISSHWIFTIFICLVISAMRCREILFQPNLTQLFRFWKWNKTWLKMCTKDRTPETSQSFTLKPFSHYLFWKHIWTLFGKLESKNCNKIQPCWIEKHKN